MGMLVFFKKYRNLLYCALLPTNAVRGTSPRFLSMSLQHLPCRSNGTLSRLYARIRNRKYPL